MTKSDPKTDDQAYQPKSYVKKTVKPGKSYVTEAHNKDYPTSKKGKGYGKQPKTPSNIDRNPDPREDASRKK